MRVGCVADMASGINPGAGRTRENTETEKTMAQVMAQVAKEQRPQASMSKEEYAAYVNERISAIPIDPSQAGNSVSIHISDEGYAAMQADPEYEAWVLDWLAQDFAFQDPWSSMCGGRYVVHNIGASKEEYRASSWCPQYAGGTGTQLYSDRSTGAVWRHDVDTVNSSPRKSTDMLDLASRLRLERLLRKQALDHARQQTELLEQASRYRQSIEAMHATGKAPISKSVAGELHGVPASYLLGMLGGMSI